MKIDVNDELLDQIVLAELKQGLDYAESALKDAKRGELHGCYSWNKDKEIKNLKKDIKAYKRLISLYSIE